MALYAVETRRKELDSLREDLQSAKDTLALMESHSTVTKEVCVCVCACVCVCVRPVLHLYVCLSHMQEYSEMKSTAAAYSKQVEYEVHAHYNNCSAITVLQASIQVICNFNVNDTKEYFVCSVFVHYCLHKSCASKDALVGGAYTHSFFVFVRTE